MSKPAVKLQHPSDRLRAWRTALFKEHNLVNTLWLNLHPVVESELYRAAQPTPWQLPKLIEKYGIRSVLNLRGRKPHRAFYALERERLEAAGVPMIDLELYSRRLPGSNELRALKEAFMRAPKPILMHCKAGADRSSLASTLYLYWFKDIPMEEAVASQMRFWPYGYIRSSKAGVIRHWLLEFAKYRKQHPDADLIEWAAQWDDPKRRRDYEKAFHDTRGGIVANLVFENILRRE